MCLSGMETVGLLKLHKAEIVQKHIREMLAALSICFREPLIFKKASLSSKFGSQRVEMVEEFTGESPFSDCESQIIHNLYVMQNKQKICKNPSGSA